MKPEVQVVENNAVNKTNIWPSTSSTSLRASTTWSRARTAWS